MADMFCWNCGLSATASELECPRCGSARGTMRHAFYDMETGHPVDPESPPQLRCWHCGQPIEQHQTICRHCSIALTDRASGADRYDVVPRSNVETPIDTFPDRPIRQWPNTTRPLWKRPLPRGLRRAGHTTFVVLCIIGAAPVLGSVAFPIWLLVGSWIGAAPDRAFASGFRHAIAETNGGPLPLEAIVGHEVEIVCIVGADRSMREIAEAAQVPLSTVGFRTGVSTGTVGIVVYGGGRVSSARQLPGWPKPAESWMEHDSRCYRGGPFAISYNTTVPIEGGRLILAETGQAPSSMALQLPDRVGSYDRLD